MAPKKLSPLTEALLEMAKGQNRIGVMDDATYRKIRVRHLGEEVNQIAGPISAEKIRPLLNEQISRVMKTDSRAGRK